MFMYTGKVSIQTSKGFSCSLFWMAGITINVTFCWLNQMRNFVFFFGKSPNDVNETKVEFMRIHSTITIPEIFLLYVVAAIVTRIVGTRANENCVLFKVDTQFVTLLPDTCIMLCAAKSGIRVPPFGWFCLLCSMFMMKFNIFCHIFQKVIYAKFILFIWKLSQRRKKPERTAHTPAQRSVTCHTCKHCRCILWENKWHRLHRNQITEHNVSVVNGFIKKFQSNSMLSGTSTMSSNQTWLFHMKYLTKFNWKMNKEQWKFNVLDFSFLLINQCVKNGKRNWRIKRNSNGFLNRFGKMITRISSELPTACTYSHRYWKLSHVLTSGLFKTHVPAIFCEKRLLANWLILVWHLEFHYAYIQSHRHDQ